VNMRLQLLMSYKNLIRTGSQPLRYAQARQSRRSRASVLSKLKMSSAPGSQFP